MWNVDNFLYKKKNSEILRGNILDISVFQKKQKSFKAVKKRFWLEISKFLLENFSFLSRKICHFSNSEMYLFIFLENCGYSSEKIYSSLFFSTYSSHKTLSQCKVCSKRTKTKMIKTAERNDDKLSCFSKKLNKQFIVNINFINSFVKITHLTHNYYPDEQAEKHHSCRFSYISNQPVCIIGRIIPVDLHSSDVVASLPGSLQVRFNDQGCQENQDGQETVNSCPRTELHVWDQSSRWNAVRFHKSVV